MSSSWKPATSASADTAWTRQRWWTSREVDVSRSTVYVYFRDKAEIVEACAEGASQKFYREMARTMGRADTLEDKLTCAAVFVTRARRFLEPEKYFDANEVSRLLTKNAAELLCECGEFLAPYLAAAKLTGEVRKDLDVSAAGEWFARMLFSLLSTPSATLDMDDDRVVAEFARRMPSTDSLPTTRAGPANSSFR